MKGKEFPSVDTEVRLEDVPSQLAVTQRVIRLF